MSEPIGHVGSAGHSPAADDAVRTRDAILGAVGFAASQFLGAASWEDAIPAVLSRLGQAARVSRAYVFQNEAGGDGQHAFSHRFEWAAPDVSAQIDNAALQGISWDGPFHRWRRSLHQGDEIYGHVRTFPADEAHILAGQGIRSIAVVPIMVGEDWWGFLGFDECVRERDWTRAELDALRAAAGTLGAAIARKRTEGALRDAEVRFRTLIEQIPAIVYTAGVGDSGDWLYISPQIESILGFTPEEWLNHPAPFSEYLHPDDRDRVMAEEDHTGVTGGTLRSDFRMLDRGGRVVWIRDEAVLIQDDESRPMFWQGLMYDVSDQKRAEEQVAYLAYHDKLTGLPNRAMFESVLDLALARARRREQAVVVLYMDLDNFKLVNDSLGHEAGDQLLQATAARLRDSLRDADIVARQGGDEFLLLLADIDRGESSSRPASESSLLTAETVAARIQELLKIPFAVGGTEFYITASIGISLFPFDAEDGKTLLGNADAAMYRSKRTGPGGYAVFSQELLDPLTKLSFTTRLRRAVERQEWTLHYQPIIDLVGGHVVSVEALLRWKDPNGGLIAPGEFIPLAEEMGLIETIGDWVMQEVSRQSQEWRAEGLILGISFNVSPRQLWQPNVVGNILRHLRANDVSPHNVVVEITESTAMTDPDRTVRILQEMHLAGLRLAIDDFGTGYSSLSRLKNMPVDILKIDRSFIRDIPEDSRAGSMVMAITQLAHGLGMVPLAEGIETEEQRRFLTEHGCTLGQGYLFNRPMPAPEVTKRYLRETVAEPTA